MTIKEFNELDKAEQHFVIAESGLMLGHKFEGEYRTILYELFDFYVESRVNMDNVEYGELKTFSRTNITDKYIKGFTFY